MSDPRLQRAVELSEQGQTAEARGLVSAYLREFPKDAEAWGIMSQLVDTPAQAIDCLERALRFAEDEFTREWAQEQIAIARGASFTPRPPTAPLPPLPPRPEPAAPPPAPPAAQEDIFSELGLGAAPAHKPGEPADEDDIFSAFGDKPRSTEADDFFATLGGAAPAAPEAFSEPSTEPVKTDDDFFATLGGAAPASSTSQAEDDFFATLGAAAAQEEKAAAPAPAPEEDDLFASLGLSAQSEPKAAPKEDLSLDWLSQPPAEPAAPPPALDLPPAPPPPVRESGIPAQFGGEPDFLSSLGLDDAPSASSGSGSLFDELDLPPAPAKAEKDEELPDLDWLEAQRRAQIGSDDEEEEEEGEDIFTTLSAMPPTGEAEPEERLASLVSEPDEDDMFATLGGPASPGAETRVSPAAVDEGGTTKARLRQAIALARQGQEKDAGRIVSDILERDPENAEAWAVMAQIVKDPKLEQDCLKNVIELSTDPKARQWAQERLTKLRAKPKTRSQRRGCVPLILMTLVAIVVLTLAGLVGVAVNVPAVAAQLPEPIRNLLPSQQIAPTPTLLGLPTAAPTATATATPEVVNTPTPEPTASPTPLPAIPAVRAIVSGTGSSVAYGPSGQALAAVVGGQGGIYTIGGSLIALGSSPASIASFSPDGLRVATGDAEGNVILWDAASGGEVSRISYGDTIYALAFSPDSSQIAVGGFTGEIVIYEVASGATALTISPEAGDPVDLAWAPDGLSLAAVMEFPTLFGSIMVFDAATGNLLNQFDTDYIISSLAYNPAGDTIAFGMRNGQVALWQPGVGAEGGLSPAVVGTPTAGPTATATAQPTPTALSPVGTPAPTTAAPGPTPEPGTALLGVLVEATEITQELIATGPNWPFVVTDVAYAPDGQLAAARLDGTVLTWLPTSGTPRTVDLGAGAVNAISWSPDSGTLALAAESGLYTVDLEPFFAAEGVGGGGISSEGTASLPEGISGLLTEVSTTTLASPVRDLAFTAEGPGIVALLNGSAIVLDLSDIALPEFAAQTDSDMTEPVAVDLSTDGLLALTADSTALAWDARGGAELASFDANEGISSAVAISPDGTRLALGGQDDNLVIIWDLTLGEALFELAGHPAALSALAWSPDGTRLASASIDGTVVIWDAAAGTPLGIYGPNPATESVVALAWSPNGRQLAVSEQAGEVGQITLLNSSNGRAEGTALILAAPARALIYTVEGLLVTGEDDGAIQVWDTTAAVAVATFSHAPGDEGSPIAALAISPDGSLLASGDGAGTVAFWSLRP